MWVCGLALLYLLVTLCVGEQVVIPDLGALEGTTTLSAWTKRPIFQFRGIPFAESPNGTLRFKPPVPYTTPFNGTFDATEFGPVCPQNSYINDKLGEESMSENCLHLNVYTPRCKCGGVGAGMPVMVYIHSGFFMAGSARNVVPDYLLEKDVVLVVPQYRLGPLGFLSLKTDEVPGNQGMLDILLALEWVNKNIENFGGDPSRVTLFGQSSGAAAANLMLFSPLVKEGLFQRMIIQGGSALAGWAVDPNPVTHGQMIAARANCTQDNLQDLGRCLRDNTTVELLLNAHKDFRNEGHTGGSHVVWNEAGNRSFLLDEPRALLKEGKFQTVPMMGGVTKHEGSFLLADMYQKFGSANMTDLDLFLTPEMKQYLLLSDDGSDLTGLVTEVMAPMDFAAMAPGLVDLVGVVTVKAPTFSMMKEMRLNAPSYLYSFNYYGRNSTYGLFSTFGLDPKYPWNVSFPVGVAHGDELLYLFPQECDDITKEETDMAKKMVQYWTTFATNGIPRADDTPDWPAFITTQGPYLKIDTTPTVQENFKDNEYTVAMREGLNRPKPRSSQMCPCSRSSQPKPCDKKQ